MGLPWTAGGAFAGYRGVSDLPRLNSVNEGTRMEPTTTRRDLTWPWPFSRADLTAGLRRHLGDPSIWVSGARLLTIAHLRPAVGRVRGMLVEYEGDSGHGSCQFVVKEPLGTTRTGLAGAGRREVGVYRSLAAQLPLQTPDLIAASQSGDWLVLEAAAPKRTSDLWNAEDYRQAIEGLAHLHDRFWDLGEDLNNYAWMGRPLEADFEVHVAAAAKALENIVASGQPQPLAKSSDRMRILASLIMYAEQVAAPLRRQPSTFLHGDYWPGNISVQADGSQVVFDWQMAAIGPSVIDLVVFVRKSEWWFDSLPLDPQEIITLYRQSLAERTGVTWTEDAWSLLWDHAMMWRFLQEWIDLLAASPNILLEASAKQLERVWLDPVAEAITRRLVIP